MSRETHRVRNLVAALAALLPLASAPTCEEVVGSLGSGEVPVVLRIATDRVFPLAIGGYSAVVDIVVETSVPFQACDMRLSWKEGAVVGARAMPHPEFDDDGALFGNTQLSARSISRVADLRHGDNAVEGPIRVARLVLRLPDASPVDLTVGGEIADALGTKFSVMSSETLTLAPAP